MSKTVTDSRENQLINGDFRGSVVDKVDWATVIAWAPITLALHQP